ncbi:hypothetical protein BTR23_07375 [Alkalihalophilus pseudofirmus]|nr:hypothetical protein BTR23_07375 [Alkalihalophilus pseudofirmus]
MKKSEKYFFCYDRYCGKWLIEQGNEAVTIAISMKHKLSFSLFEKDEKLQSDLNEWNRLKAVSN